MDVPMYQQIHETKICLILDSRTPIVTKIPVAPGLLTLGAFKRHTSLNDDCYKFYFKSHDSEFGTVKEELVDDDSVLPVEDGRSIVWVISNSNPNQASTLFSSENPYDKLGDVCDEPRFEEQSNFYKAPTHIKSNQRTNHEHIYDQMIVRRPPDDVMVVSLYLNANDTIGLTILCPNGAGDRGAGLVVDKVLQGSVAAQDGRICPGDKIVGINGHELLNTTPSEAITIFSKVVERKGAINLCLLRESRLPVHDSSGPSQPRHHNFKPPPIKIQPIKKTPSPAEGVFDPATELPMPILDPGVLSTPDRYNQRRTNTHRGTFSLPRSLTPRSLYTTSNLDTLTSSSDLRLTLDSQSVYGPSTPSSLRQIGVPLHCGKDSISTIYAYLKSDAASLDIRDREWLKVVVKDAFLGSTLVKWLSRNVYGFCNRSETKRYANKMLSLELIKGPMSSGTFSEKCYYVLT